MSEICRAERCRSGALDFCSRHDSVRGRGRRNSQPSWDRPASPALPPKVVPSPWPFRGPSWPSRSRAGSPTGATLESCKGPSRECAARQQKPRWTKEVLSVRGGDGPELRSEGVDLGLWGSTGELPLKHLDLIHELDTVGHKGAALNQPCLKRSL